MLDNSVKKCYYKFTKEVKTYENNRTGITVSVTKDN